MLSDHDLRSILGEMQFETDEPSGPFEAGVQVQPCSIDLRLDRCFWRTRKPKVRGTIDLRRAGAGELDVGRLFRAHWCRQGEGVTLRPGEMVLGRTFEKFTVPNGFCGRIHGRSSYARLGLAVHCTGDFINPGYRGRMPLQLVNHGAVPIVLAPYMHVCQLTVGRTSSPSDVPYGTELAGHTYMNDDGGPSRFWRDRGLRNLQEAIRNGGGSDGIRGRLLEVVSRRDVETMDRFTNFFGSLRPDEVTSAREVMERFAAADTKRYEWRSRGLEFTRWFCLLAVTVAVGTIFKQPYGRLQHWAWAVGLLCLLPGLWAKFFAREPAEPFTREQVTESFPASA